ncbi:efflux transporter outer membrane subunit [Burkholderia sp. L27(2015)]|uniref:efflux transporter outer membrane subunit n=1 Tax=Burkholderia sp. L27(2015) TaxID=1641858 RepID=UPI0020B1541E|nr:efflux transporter outer membrane subunit [Burkholderia sp. L27(2015)]
MNDVMGRLAHRMLFSALFAILFATLLGACTFGPDGHTTAPQPAHYGVEPLPAQTDVAQGVAQHFALGARPVPQWWRAYGSAALDAMVDEALRNNYDLTATTHTLTAAHEQLRAQIGESLLPSVDLGGQASRQRAIGEPLAGQSSFLYNLFDAQVSTHYTFDVFGAARFADTALAAQIDAQSYQRDAARRMLAANVVTTALNAALLHEQIATTERLLILSETDAAQAQRRYQLGANSRDDSLNLAAASQTLRASLPGLRTQWLAQRHALAVLMGRTPDAAPEDLDLSGVSVPDPVPVAIPSELLKQRPDILAADALVKANAAGVSVATAQMFPSLSLSAAYGQGGFTWLAATGGAGALWNAGLSLSQPLFHGGALRARRRAAEESYQAAVANYQQTVLNAFQNVADALSALTHDAQALDGAAMAAQHDGQVWRDAEQRAALGAIAADSVRASERQYQNARLSEIRARGARLIDTAVLFQAMGVPAVGKHADVAQAASAAAGASSRD